MTTFQNQKEGTPRHPSRTHAEPGTGLKRLPGVARSFRSSAHQTRLVESRRVGAALKQLHEERPWAGGTIVAKAWTDPAFKQELLSIGREALREMGVHQESRQVSRCGE